MSRRCVRILITVCPMPERASDEFEVTAESLSKDFETTEPAVTGQASRNGGQYIKMSFAVFPAEPSGPGRGRL